MTSYPYRFPFNDKCDVNYLIHKLQKIELNIDKEFYYIQNKIKDYDSIQNRIPIGCGKPNKYSVQYNDCLYLDIKNHFLYYKKECQWKKIHIGGPDGPIGATGPTGVTGPTGPTGATASIEPTNLTIMNNDLIIDGINDVLVEQATLTPISNLIIQSTSTSYNFVDTNIKNLGEIIITKIDNFNLEKLLFVLPGNYILNYTIKLINLNPSINPEYFYVIISPYEGMISYDVQNFPFPDDQPIVFNGSIEINVPNSNYSFSIFSNTNSPYSIVETLSVEFLFTLN